MVFFIGIGHCIPIAVARSSEVLVKKILENSDFHHGSFWFLKAAGVDMDLFAIYFIAGTFMGS